MNDAAHVNFVCLPPICCRTDDGGVGLDFEFEQDLYTVPESGTIPPNQDNVQLICVELNNPSDVVEATLLTSPISATGEIDALILQLYNYAL